jgi:hypothetical protein
MLEIQVLGTGCAGCVKMYQLVIEVLDELGVRNAQVELITEQRMIDYGLLGDRAPGLLINGQLAWAGSVPAREDVLGWLAAARAASQPEATEVKR